MNLFQRRVVKDAKCPFCLNEDETTMHAIWECPAATDVWAEKGNPVSLSGWEEFKLATGRKEGAINQCVKRGVVGGKEWKKPIGSKLKANFDAAIDVSSKKLGIRVVIRDDRGELVAACSAIRVFNSVAFVVECYALWEAMVLCEELGLGTVIFEGDAKGVTEAVSKEEKNDSCWGHLVEGLQQKLGMFDRWETGFVHREGNEVAHQLAKLALHGECDMYWVEEGPDLITNQLLIDKLYMDTDTSC
ncbi:uncharacterized protein LOC108997798 [Juglans regia]|uniref:Uncharacterized protein LOC108997798 n=1 Tax=Juglans regia TaxID=51240 RepID=A0A6P9EET8_JUGRE|nr:uncharacterized protein LOC108997798 [Juglans regia]